MATPFTNFGLVTVAAGHGAGDTAIDLTSGHGSKLPATTGGYTYPVTWWNATDYAHPADDPNVEIVLVTTISSDTLTVTRAQEGTSATTKNTSGKVYRMMLGITANVLESFRIPKSTHYGLQLQTHRDADKAGAQVELLAVDAIIMHDGTELRNDAGEWTGKTANSALSGAGGLDSGTVEEFTWYEIHAIAKEDNTRNLLLHKSKLWSISANHTSAASDAQPIREASGNTRVAQGFTFSGGLIPFVDLTLKKVGSPTGYYWVTIEATSAGAPSGTALLTSQKFDVSRLSTAFTYLRIPTPMTTSLSSSPTVYWVVIHGDWAIDGTNYIAAEMEGTSATYSNGTKSLFNGTSWTADADDDLHFAVGSETAVASVTMPTGYTKRCFLGWVYSDTGSLFRQFLQIGTRHFVSPVSSAACNIGGLTGSASLFTTADLLPSRNLITAYLACTGTGTGTAVAAVGDLRATDISPNSNSVGAQVVLHGSSTTLRPSQPASVAVQVGAIMANGTSGARLWLTGFEW